MTHVPVWPGGDDCLFPLLLDAYRWCQVRVFPKGQEHDRERTKQGQYSQRLKPEGKMPALPVAADPAVQVKISQREQASSASKDTMIAALRQRIKRLEEENRTLKQQVEVANGLL